MHAFISKDNDRLIKESLTNGRALPAQGQGQGRTRRRPAPTRHAGARRNRPGVTVVDLWVNALSGKAAAAFMGQAGNEGIPELLGGDLSSSSTLQHLLVAMDSCGVDVGVLAAGIASEETARFSTRWPPTRTACVSR